MQHIVSAVAACGALDAGSVILAHRFSCAAACGIFQDPRIEQGIPSIARWILNHWATREALTISSVSFHVILSDSSSVNSCDVCVPVGRVELRVLLLCRLGHLLCSIHSGLAFRIC